MEKTNNKLVWASVIMTIAISVCQCVLGANHFALLLWIVMCVLLDTDRKKVNQFLMMKNGLTKKPLRFWHLLPILLFIPYYVYKRNKLLEEKQTTFYVWMTMSILCWVLSIVMIVVMIASA